MLSPAKPVTAITAKAVDIFRAGPEKLAPEYPFFPQPLHDPFSGRFNVFRGQLGDAVGRTSQRQVRT